MRGTHRQLLEDPEVERWYRNVARGSEVTADVYLRRLGSFCRSVGLTPKELWRVGGKKLYNLLLDFVSAEEEKGRAGSYIESTLKAVKSWLAHHNRTVVGKIKIRGARDTPSLAEERVPTKEELRRIFLSGDKKARAASVLVAHSGLRIETLGNYRGDDGLRLGDLPELRVRGGEVEFERVPAMVIVRRELSKARHRYFTFLSEEGCGYLKDYLEERMRRGEVLTAKSPLITSRFRGIGFITAANVGDAIRSAIRNAGFPWRPYVLRSYFDTQLMLAESKGLVLRDYRTFWMGHKGDIEARYTTNKCRLPEDVVESMREAYRRAQEYLQTAESEKAPSKEEMALEAMRRVAETFGIDPLKVRIEKQKELGREPEFGEEIEALQAEIRKLRISPARFREDCNGNCARYESKLIGEEELVRYLNEGWEIVRELNSGRIVVRRPSPDCERV